MITATGKLISILLFTKVLVVVVGVGGGGGGGGINCGGAFIKIFVVH